MQTDWNSRERGFLPSFPFFDVGGRHSLLSFAQDHIPFRITIVEFCWRVFRVRRTARFVPLQGFMLPCGSCLIILPCILCSIVMKPIPFCQPCLVHFIIKFNNALPFTASNAQLLLARVAHAMAVLEMDPGDMASYSTAILVAGLRCVIFYGERRINDESLIDNSQEMQQLAMFDFCQFNHYDNQYLLSFCLRDILTILCGSIITSFAHFHPGHLPAGFVPGSWPDRQHQPFCFKPVPHISHSFRWRVILNPVIFADKSDQCNNQICSSFHNDPITCAIMKLKNFLAAVNVQECNATCQGFFLKASLEMVMLCLGSYQFPSFLSLHQLCTELLQMVRHFASAIHPKTFCVNRAQIRWTTPVFRLTHAFSNVRIGEAKNPGPRSETVVNVAICNPTTIGTKLSTVEDLLSDQGIDVLTASETAATLAAQHVITMGLHRDGYKATWSSPVPEYRVRVDGNQS